MPDEKLRYLGTHDYTYALPPYAYDDRGNIVDKDGNILDVKYNRETGREYYVIQGTNQTSEPVLEGMGYEDYQKLLDKMGEEGGMIRYMRILSGMMEGVPGAIDEYFGALEDYNKFAKGAGRRYLAAMALSIICMALLVRDICSNLRSSSRIIETIWTNMNRFGNNQEISKQA